VSAVRRFGFGDAASGARSDRLIPVAIAAIVLAIAVSTVTSWPVGAFEDDAIYTVLAKSLAEGTGYRLINLPGAPNATHYPPAYPALLALLWKILPSFPDNLVLFKFANALLLAIAATGTYVFAHRCLELGKVTSAITALASTLSVVILLLTGMVLSEPLFLAILAPALLVTERARRTGHIPTALLAGLLLGLLALSRTLGLFAIPGAVLLMLLRRRYAAAATMAFGAAVLVAPWLVWVHLHQYEVPPIIAGKYGSYSGWVATGYVDYGIGFVWAVVVKNSRGLFRLIGGLHSPVDTIWLRTFAAVTLLILLAVGAWRLAHRAPSLLLFLLIYVAVILLWPFEPSRFVLGIWTVLACCAALGVQGLWQWRPHRNLAAGTRYALLASCLWLAAGYAVYNGQGFRHAWWIPVQQAGGERLKPIVEWVAHNTAMTDVISTDHDPAVYLYTGRRAVPTSTWIVRERIIPLTPEEDVNAVRKLLADLQPHYYVPTSQIGLRTAEALARSKPPALRYLGPTPNGAAFARVSR
jgi:hypothetical protein